MKMSTLLKAWFIMSAMGFLCCMALPAQAQTQKSAPTPHNYGAALLVSAGNGMIEGRVAFDQQQQAKAERLAVQRRTVDLQQEIGLAALDFLIAVLIGTGTFFLVRRHRALKAGYVPPGWSGSTSFFTRLGLLILVVSLANGALLAVFAHSRAFL